MSMYDEISKSTLKLIAQFGRYVSIKRDDKGVYSPLTNSFTGASNQQFTVKAVITGYRINEIDGELVKRTDKKVLFDSSADIRKGDIIIDGDNYTVIDIEVINPGEKIILFKAQARK